MGSVKIVGGACKAGAALSTCQSGLFASSRSKAVKILIVMMAGTSTDEIKLAVESIKSSGVIIVCLGMGSLFDRAQLVSMATMESYVMTASSWSKVVGMYNQITRNIRQGKSNVLQNVLRSCIHVFQ